MRKLLFLLSLLFLATAVSGQVQYQVDTDEEKILKNTTVKLDCSNTCPGLSWSLSSGEKVLHVRDGQGEISDYDVNGDELDIPGRRFARQEERVLEIRTRIDREAEEIHEGLYKRTVQFSGFPDEETSGMIKSPKLLSGRVGFGFDMSFEDREMRFQGEGPVNVRLKSGEGYDTRYFSFFGDRPGDTEMAYEVPVGTTGLVQDFERFPVAVHTDESYDLNINDWSSGEYVAGSIQIRDQESLGGKFLPVLAHEVVHGLNDRELTWDQTSSSYFDEGTATYVEFLMEKKLYREGERDRPPRELFGDAVRYREGRHVYRVPPRGDSDQLWNYYQDEQDFMKYWNAHDSEGDTRSFGYAYSQLIIRNYISRMNGSLQDFYRELEVDQKVEDPEVKWEIYSGHLDMTPCDYDSRGKFEGCLEEINDYDYPVYSAEPDRDTKQLEIERLEVPELEKPSVSQVSEGEVTLTEFVKGFIDYIVMELSSFFKL